MKARLQPVLFLAAAHFLNASCLHFYVLPSRRLSRFLSLNPHPLNWVLFLPYELEIESNWMFDFFECPIFFERARTRVSGRSRAGVLVLILFRFQFNLYSIRSMRWQFFVELAAGLDLASFRKNVVHSSPRPRELNWNCRKQTVSGVLINLSLHPEWSSGLTPEFKS